MVHLSTKGRGLENLSVFSVGLRFGLEALGALTLTDPHQENGLLLSYTPAQDCCL